MTLHAVTLHAVRGLRRRWPLLLAFGLVVGAAGPAVPGGTVAALVRWLPLVLTGFLFNVVIGVLAMALGTVLGLPLGLTQLAAARPVRGAGWVVIQFLRNAPWLVLLFYVMFLLPFEVRVGGLVVPLPASFKAVVGLALPVSANVAEIVRGGRRCA